MRNEWRDPRDGVTWVVSVWESAGPLGAAGAIPRVISFRRLAAFDVVSTELDGATPVGALSDEEMQRLLDRALRR